MQTSDLPSLRPDPEPWWVNAACLGADPNIFFPNNDAGRNATVPPEAAALCTSCPVSSPCLQHALQHHEHGIWANTTEQQRQQMRRRRRARPQRPPPIEHGTPDGRAQHYRSNQLPVCEACERAWDEWRRRKR